MIVVVVVCSLRERCHCCHCWVAWAAEAAERSRSRRSRCSCLLAARALLLLSLLSWLGGWACRSHIVFLSTFSLLITAKWLFCWQNY